MALTGRYVWRDFVSDGIPSSGKHKPTKAEIRAWGTALEEALALTAQTLSASVARATFAELNAVVGDYANGDIGLVVLDDDLDLRGVYQKESGVWVKKAELPNEAAQIAEQAALAAQAAQAAAEAAAAGVDLPPIAPNRMLVDNAAGTARESKTFEQVRDLLDPLNGFAADGVTDDTAKFTALRALYPKTEFDLKGKAYLVSAIPSGPFRNGFFKIASFEGQLSALIPAKSTIETALTCLSAGPYYSAWPQDKWHMWDGVVYAFWMEGTVHSTSDTNKYVVCMRSKDGGKTWTQKERIGKNYYPGAGCSSFAACVVDGVQFIVLRNDTTNECRLVARRLAQRYELKDCIDTTSGSAEFDIDFADSGVVIGALEGMSATFGAVGTVGGLAISGAYPVSFMSGARIQFTHPNTATSTVVNAGGTGLGEGGSTYFGMFFNETAFQEIPIGGTTLGEAIAAAFNGGTNPVHLHSASGMQPTGAKTGSTGSFFLGVSGGDVNAGVALVKYPFDTNGSVGGKTIQYCSQIPVASALGEPAVAYVGNVNGGKVYGFIRTQDPAVPAAFFFGTHGGTAATALTNIQVSNFPAGCAVQSPIPIEVVGEWIYGFASGTRYGTVFPGTGKKAVALYLLRAKITDAEALGAAAFEWILIDDAYFADHYFAVNNGVGVSSLVALDDKTLIAGFSSEVDVDNPAQGPVNVYSLKIGIGDLTKTGKSRVEVGQVVNLNDAYWFWRGCGAAANGAYVVFTAEVIETAPRAYDSATGYFTPPETGLYHFSGEVRYAVGTIGEKSLALVDEADANVLGGLLVGMSYTSTTTAEAYGQFHIPVFLRQGQKVRMKVTAPNGTASSTIRSYLSVRKLS